MKVHGLITVFLFSLLAGNCAEEFALTNVVVGRGVPQVLALGMTLKQIGTVVPALNVQPMTNDFNEVEGYSVSVPTKGISFHVRTSNAPLSLINFDVAPEMTNRFRGFCGSLRFGNNAINKATITNMFGAVTAPDGRGARHDEISKRLARSEDFAIQTAADHEMLYYASKGVMFDLRNGVVVRFAVMTTPAPIRKR